MKAITITTIISLIIIIIIKDLLKVKEMANVLS